MSRDSSNKQHPDSRAAISAALAGLDQAREAMAWMETMATVDGDYPVLKS